jgi:hypothetical protein
MTKDRRRSPRIQILGKLHGQLVALATPVTVIEISLGGLGLETAVEFPVGVVHEFRLTLGDDSAVLVKGRVMHCHRADAPDRSPRFIVGVQFVDDDAGDAHPVGDLIGRIS